MSSTAHLTKVLVSTSVDDDSVTTYETWTSIEGVSDPDLYEVVDGNDVATAEDLLNVLEGRADIEYV